MIYVLCFLLYVYIFTGVILSVKLFNNILGKVLGAVYFGALWLPILLADYIKFKILGYRGKE